MRAVEALDLDVADGEVLGIVGESGSGKCVAMLAVMGLIRPPGRVQRRLCCASTGSTCWRLSPRAAPRPGRQGHGDDLPGADDQPEPVLHRRLADRRGAARPPAACRAPAARARTIELLRQVGIPAPEQRIGAFPHQLSGGMNQRVMIAMAIACNPRLLIADEPTTALDVTIQKQILDLLATLQRERGMALVLITHDMGVVAETAHRVQVMYAGQAMETRPAAALLDAPAHPYTAALLAALPEHARRASPSGDHSGRGARRRRPPGRLPVRAALPFRLRPLRRAPAAALRAATARCAATRRDDAAHVPRT